MMIQFNHPSDLVEGMCGVSLEVLTMLTAHRHRRVEQRLRGTMARSLRVAQLLALISMTAVARSRCVRDGHRATDTRTTATAAGALLDWRSRRGVRPAATATATRGADARRT